MAKMCVESIALRFITNNINCESIIKQKELVLIREYARYGNGDFVWPVNFRKIYNEGDTFGQAGQRYEVLHEFDFLFTKENELYFIFACGGIEYAMNAGGPCLEGYHKWLRENNFKSPLYLEGIRTITPKQHS